jgi:DNA-binding SARP family transcriptional activator
LSVQLLGDAVFRYGATRIRGLETPRLQAFLAVLLLHRGAPLQRTRLAYRLWPDSSDGQALTNLRHLLHDLRKALPAHERFLEITLRTVGWRTGAPFKADATEFLDALERADEAADEGQARAALERAAAAYRGDLLPGCWDDVTAEQREWLHRLALEGLGRLAGLEEAAGEVNAAVAAAERRLALDPLDEPTYRLLMRLHLRSGARPRALRVYERCAAVLASELGVEPDAETTKLRAAAAGGPALSDPGGVVGRAAEWAQARAAWHHSRAGRAGMLLVAGEPGIGKTHLLEELARHAASSGGTVLRSRCYETSGRLAWAPVAEWLRDPALATALQRLDEVWVAELSRLVPEVRPRPVPRPPFRALDGDGRRRLFEAVERLLGGLSRPALLLVDDLQWCDTETLDFLDYLLCHERGAPLLVAGSLRSGEPSGSSALARLMESLARLGALDEIALDRLDERATAALAANLLGRRLEEGSVRRLFAETEGNPLFVVEALRAGLEGGGEASWLTPTVKAVITSRLAALSPAAATVVESAAVIGRSFSLDVLDGATELGEEAVVRALDELWERRIVREQGGAYDFAHDKIREVAYATVSPARRRRVHRAVARTLSALHGDAPGAVSARLAEHFEKGGSIADAISALRQAARYSASVFAVDDSIEKLEKALRLLPQVPFARRRDELELEIRVEMGAPVVARHGYGAPETNRIYGRARTLSRRLGRAISPPVLRGLAIGAVADCRFAEARSFGEDLLACRGDDVAVVEGHYVLGVASFWAGELEAAEDHLRQALERYRPDRVEEHLTRFAQDPRAVCLCRLGHTLWHRGQAESAMRLVSEAVRAAEALDHPTSHGYALVYAAWVAGEVGDLRAMRHWVRAGVGRWTRQRLGFFRPATPLFLGWLRLRSGDEGGEKLLRKGVEGWRRDGRTLHFTHALSLLAGVLLGRAGGEGLRIVEEALRWTEEREQRYLEPELVRLRGEHLIQAGRAEEGAGELRRAATTAAAMGAGAFELRAALSLARHQGDVAQLRALVGSLPEERGSADGQAAATFLA